ncbi:TonB-dependent receptor domain-containing protein [Chitinophaga sp. LS1]|uniref:TonB-dependent receptor domain-containing protein n=1 Tax=Chitinophaga sp. LS1 TaxID=3051176 RepID=UPI002AAA9833|nr:TonB-dependent receptor [Chitinophaga sp. LS1]WPV66925.1 TonB-dependent receptor [Chitinophaga sp. LS1]
MKRLIVFFTLVILFFNARLYAQYILQGKISDSLTNSALELVTITLEAGKGEQQIAFSDSTGYYKLNINERNSYRLKFSFLNYGGKELSLWVDGDTTINIAMKRNTQLLNSVDIKGKKPIIERKIDRLIFNVSNNINTNGADVMELLSKTPQVKVDGNAIRIIGKEEVSIMINNRPLQFSADALANYLKSLPAESVESIEIMTTPPAMYNAQGSSGIINIILKRKKELGYNGTLTLYAQKTREQLARSNISLNYNKKNIRYFAIAGVAKGSRLDSYSGSIYYSDQTQVTKNDVKELSQFASGQFGFDADLGKNSLVGASINILYSYPYQTGNNYTTFLNKNKGIDSISDQYIKNNITYKTASANVHYEKFLDSLHKKQLTVDADWTIDHSALPRSIDNNLYDGERHELTDRYSQLTSNNFQSSKFYSLNAIVKLPAKKHDLSFGAKVNFIKNDNDVDLNTHQIGIDDFYSRNVFKLNENTQALFLNYSTTIGKRLTFQSGLRGEYTQTKGHSYNGSDTINHNNYFNLFPTVYLQYKLNDKNQLTIDYGRRINRPSFTFLNPFRRYLSQYQYLEGDPYLTPSITNNFSISETCNNLNFSLSYSFSDDKIGVIGIPDEDTKITATKYANFLSSQFVQAGVSYYQANIKWLESVNEVYVYYNSARSSLSSTAAVTDGWGAIFRSNNTFYFNKDKTLAGGVEFNYQSKDVSDIEQNAGYYYFNITGRYRFPNGKLQIGLNVNDIFRTRKFSSSYIANGILITNSGYNDARKVGLTMRYNFGNKKLKTGNAHSSETNTGRAGS